MEATWFSPTDCSIPCTIKVYFKITYPYCPSPKPSISLLRYDDHRWKEHSKREDMRQKRYHEAATVQQLVLLIKVPRLSVYGIQFLVRSLQVTIARKRQLI